MSPILAAPSTCTGQRSISPSLVAPSSEKKSMPPIPAAPSSGQRADQCLQYLLPHLHVLDRGPYSQVLLPNLVERSPCPQYLLPHLVERSSCPQYLLPHLVDRGQINVSNTCCPIYIYWTEVHIHKSCCPI